MLNRVKFTVTFKNPARTFSQDIEFNTGLTAIVGPNGKGKSLILEMVQYALFGTAALRGKADDYAHLESTVWFDIKGSHFRVERNQKGCLLSEKAEGEFSTHLATGTKPVNAAILSLFGYTYDVFTVANVANQGAIEQLGDMKPTERRKLIDETIGLNALDQLTAYIQSEITSLNSEIKGIEKVLVEPTAPIKPETYEPSGAIEERVNVLSEERRARDVLQHTATKELKAPEKVELEHDDAELNRYEKAEEERKGLMSQYIGLKGSLDKIPFGETAQVMLHPRNAELSILQAQKQARDRLTDRRNHLVEQLKGMPLPIYTEAELDQEEALQKMLKRWLMKQELLENRVVHECPACEHEWHDDDPRLVEYKDVPEERPVPLGWSVKLIREQRNLLAQKPQRLKLEAEAEELLDQIAKLPDVSDLIQEIEALRLKYAESEEARINAAKRADLEASIKTVMDAFEKTKDYGADIARIQETRKKYYEYRTKMELHDKQLAEVNAAKEALAQFDPELDTKLHELKKQYDICREYEFILAGYEIAKVKYDTNFEVLTKLKSELEDWVKGKAAVADLRAKVKGYLLPSLNAVASHLINEMTGGELSWIIVNDQFEITVEGQRLETLSGSGKAVANLALRLALGSVLTNRVFSVVMLDEIDASADNDRAKYIALCLQNLTRTISQIIQVSHKGDIVADNVINL